MAALGVLPAVEEDLAEAQRLANLWLRPQANLRWWDDRLSLHPRALALGGVRSGRERSGTLDSSLGSVVVGTQAILRPSAGLTGEADGSVGRSWSDQRGWDPVVGQGSLGFRWEAERWTAEWGGGASRDRVLREESFELALRRRLDLRLAVQRSGPQHAVGLRMAVRDERQDEATLRLPEGQADAAEFEWAPHVRYQPASRWWWSVETPLTRHSAVARGRLPDWTRRAARLTQGWGLTERFVLEAQVGIEAWDFDQTATTWAMAGDTTPVLPTGSLGIVWEYREGSSLRGGWSDRSVPSARAYLARRQGPRLQWWHHLPGPWAVAVDAEHAQVDERGGPEAQWWWWGRVRVIAEAGEGLRFLLNGYGERTVGDQARDGRSVTLSGGVLLRL